jgi:hypothetical protein
MLGAAFAIEVVVLVQTALAHRPSKDQDPSTLAVAGTSAGAFLVLHSSTPTHIAKTSQSNKEATKQAESNATSQKEPAENAGGPAGEDVRLSAPKHKKTPVASNKDISESRDDTRYAWTRDGAKWASQYFQGNLATMAPQPGQKVKPEQAQVIRRATGEHNAEKGVSMGILQRVESDQATPDHSSLLQISQLDPDKYDVTSLVDKNNPKRNDPELLQDVREHGSIEVDGQHAVNHKEHSKPDPGVAVQKVRSPINSGSTTGNAEKGNNAIGGRDNSEQSMAPRHSEGTDNSARNNATIHLRKVLDDVNKAGVDQGKAKNLEHIEEIQKAKSAAEKAGASQSLMKEAQMLIDVLEKADEVEQKRTDANHIIQAEESRQRLSPRRKEALVSVVVALLLLGFITFDLCILYMVNYPDPQVQSYSYKMVGQTISVLSAVLLETAQMDFFVEGIIFQKIFKNNASQRLGHGEHPLESTLDFEAHDPHSDGTDESWYEFLACLGLFFVWYSAINILSRLCRQSHEGLFMVNAVVAHEAAFVCIHTFADLQEVKAHGVSSDSARWFYTAYPFGLFVFLRILTLVSEGLRDEVKRRSLLDETVPPVTFTRSSLQNRADSAPPMPSIAEGEAAAEIEDEEETMQADSGSSPQKLSENRVSTVSAVSRNSLNDSHQHIDWFEYVSESEDEMCAIVIGYMLRQSTLYFVCDRIPMIEGDFAEHSPAMFSHLLLVICIYVLLLTATTWYISHYHHSTESRVMQSKDGRRFVQFLQVLWAMTIAWHFLGLARWRVQLMVTERALQFVANAFLLSPLCIFIVILVDKLADNMLIYENTAEIIIESVGLLVGFAWEKAFHHAAHTVIEFVKREHTFDSIGTETSECILCLGLVAFMLPAWRHIIVPFSSQPVPQREWCKGDPQASLLASKRTSAILGQQIRASLANLKQSA